MENIEAMLCAYIEGDLDGPGRAQIETHLEKNPQHQKLLQELMAMRDLVRALPRAKAPLEVGESLRQKVERSMLLEDSASARPPRPRADRWPQFFAIAAIFLLFTSLFFILYKALSPTLKPAVFSQMAAGKLPDLPAATAVNSTKLDDLVAVQQDAAASSPPNQLLVAKSNPVGNAQVEQVAQAPRRDLPNDVQAFAARMQKQTAAVAQVDLESIRRRLQSSGYGIGQPGDKNPQPTLMVVNSSNPPLTKVQITQFLNNNTGISWNAIPQETELNAGLPSVPPGAGRTGGGGGFGGGGIAAGNPAGFTAARSVDANPTDLVAAPMNSAVSGDRSKNSDATTQPSSDVYVARGLTAQQVDALKQTLIVPRNGSDVQVTVQSAQGLATTQPSIAVPKDVNALGFTNNSTPTSQPVETANSAADLAAPPAQPAGASDFQLRDQSVAGNVPILQSVDTVIVLQPTEKIPPIPAAGPVAPTTQPQPFNQAAALSPPSTQPAPATQP